MINLVITSDTLMNIMNNSSFKDIIFFISIGYNISFLYKNYINYFPKLNKIPIVGSLINEKIQKTYNSIEESVKLNIDYQTKIPENGINRIELHELLKKK